MSAGEFSSILAANGLAPENLVADGRLHRCATATKPGKLNGAYVLHSDFPASGWWQNHETGEVGTWTEKKNLSRDEKRILAERAKREKAQRATEETARHAEAARAAADMLSQARQPDRAHPYLVKKCVAAYGDIRQGKDGALLLPLVDTNGKVQTLQRIYPDGTKRFLTGGKKTGHFTEIPGATDQPLYVCEGYATGASIHQATGAGVIVAFDAGNLKPVALAVKKSRPGVRLVIAADNDTATPGNPGVTQAKAAAMAVGAGLAVPLLPEEAGTDFNDLHMAAGLSAVKEQIGRATVPPENNSRFVIKESGVYAVETDSDGNTEEIWFCSPLRVKAYARDASGDEWGRLLELINPDGQTRSFVLSMRDFAGEGEPYRAILLSMGLELAPGLKGRYRLHDYLASSRPSARVRSVARVGWHGRAYVLPDAAYGEHGAESVVLQAPLAESLYRRGGSLAGWQSTIGAWCMNNPRLMFAVCAGFSGPLLSLASCEGGGFHFWGGSSLGKTTLLRAAGSVAGGGGSNGFLRQWRATDNGLEAIAAMHNDNLLCLDEIGQASSKVVAETAYMLANGQGKGRAGKDGSARKAATWALVFLSSGEMTLGDKIREDGRRAMAGQAVRVADIAADAGFGSGIFSDLHRFADGAALSRAISEAAETHYGHPLHAFLQALTQDRDRAASESRALVSAIANRFTERQGESDGQVIRMAGRFAMIAAAGQMAARYGVVPWDEPAPALAASACFQSWLELRGGVGSAEEAEVLRHVRAFFDTNGTSRFEDMCVDYDLTVQNRAGYKHRFAGQTEYLVFPETFRKELCLNMSPKNVAALLIKRGWLVSGANGKAADSVRIKGFIGTRRMYRFRFPGNENAV